MKDELLHAGIESFLWHDDFEIIEKAYNGDDAAHYCSQGNAEVLITEIELPDADGLEVLGRVKTFDESIGVVILSPTVAPYPFCKSFLLGASSWLHTSCSPEQLQNAVTLASQLHRNWPKAQLDYIQANIRDRDERFPFLTNRESQVLYYIAVGLTDREISLTMELSSTTISRTIHSLYKKIRVADRLQATHFAFRYGIIESEPPVKEDS